MTRKNQKTPEEQVRTQDQDAAPADVTTEKIFLAMIGKQQDMESFMLKMMSGKQALEKELEQQWKEHEKEREERIRDEDWLRNIELPDIAGNDRDKAGEPHKQASYMARVKWNAHGVVIVEPAAQMEKDAMEKEIREEEEVERR